MRGSIIIALACIALVACTTGNVVQEQQTIRIGELAALSGFGAEWGEAEREGVELAVAQANAEGGINGVPLEVIVQDTQSDFMQTLAAYKYLRNDEDIQYIIGPTLTEFGAVLLPAVEEDTEVFALSATGSFDTTPTVASNYFTTLPSLSWSVRPISDYLESDDKIALVSAQNQFCQSLHRHFTRQAKERDITVAADEVVAPTEADYRTIITKFKATGIDTVVVFLVTPADLMEFMEQAANLGLDAQIISVLIDPPFVQQHGKNIEGLLYTWPIDGPGYAQFVSDFEAHFGRSPGLPSTQTAYDAANLLIAGLRSGARTSEELSAYMRSVKEYPGVIGTITFDQYNMPQEKPYAMLLVQNGQAVSFEE